MAVITILGSGGFGISLGIMLNNHGHKVTIWSAFEKEIDDIKRDGENKAKLPGVKINKDIEFTTDLNCINGSEIVLMGIPTKFVRSVAKQASPYITSDMIVVNTSKGLEDGTYKRMSEVISEEIPQSPVVVLSGPSHAEEVAIGMPTTVVASCKDEKYADYIQNVMSNSVFRVYKNDDVVGCELGGALKNIIALCAGICDGMGFGDNTKAALMTRGITEIARLGVAMGAKDVTFAGLTGIGDLIVTCTSMHSRNRRAGILIGKGTSAEEAVKQIGTVEGFACTKVAYELAHKIGVDMPITEQCYNVLYNNIDSRSALNKLMVRPGKHETEDVWVD